jgi:fumarate reductase subunit C
MSAAAGARPPYRRPMQGWWRRDPFFKHYMLREATALAVLIYAIVLTLGIVRLAQGAPAWQGWLQALRSPQSLVLHGVLLAAMLLHAKSWFEIMPKTMPMLFIGGRRVAATTITRCGWAGAVMATVALFALAARWRP